MRLVSPGLRLRLASKLRGVARPIREAVEMAIEGLPARLELGLCRLSGLVAGCGCTEDGAEDCAVMRAPGETIVGAVAQILGGGAADVPACRCPCHDVLAHRSTANRGAP